jgi:RNA polymerase sigma-B factor
MTDGSSDRDAELARFVELTRTGDRRLRDELVADHLELAGHVARRFVNRGEPYDDLFQVASMALVKAVDRFDPEVGVKFSTFAVKYIVGELKRHFRDRGWAIRAPRRVQELYLELGHHIERLSQELGRPPTVAELAVAVGHTEEEVLEATEAGRNYRTSSLDAPVAGGQTLSSVLSEVDRSLSQVEERSLLAKALEHLTPRDRVIVHLRFVEGLTQSEIAGRVGLSQMQISRILTANVELLRQLVTEGDDGRLRA